MITTADFFEVKSESNETLAAILKKHSSIQKVEKQDDNLIVYLNEPLSASELNRYLFENNIVLEHLVKRNNSLEEAFIALISNS